MALQGLSLTTFIGWTFGIICLDRPWGRPKFSGWISVSSCVNLVYLVIFNIFTIDILINSQDELLQLYKDPTGNALLTIINRSAFLELLLSNFLVSIVFKIQAKKFAKLWGDLYDRNYEDAKKPKFYSGICGSIAFSVVSAILIMAIGFKDLIPFGYNYEKSWFSFVGLIPYIILVFMIMIAPYVVPINIGYGCVVVTLHHLGWVYDRHCQKIQDMMVQQGGNSKQKESLPSDQDLRRRRRTLTAPFKMTQELKEEVFDEFERIQELFSLSEVTLSPIVLIILSGGTFRLVLAAARVTLRNYEEVGEDNWYPYIRDIFYWVLTVGYLIILQVGQKMRNKFEEWKEKLRKVSIELGLATDPSYEARDVNDLHLVIRNWDWHFSACGFFDVDRKLVSGIISLLLTYTVILVQLQITFDSLQRTHNNGTNSTSVANPTVNDQT